MALSFKIAVLNTLLNWIQESGLLFLHILNVWPCVYQFLWQYYKVSTTCHIEVQKIRMEWLGAAYGCVHSANVCRDSLAGHTCCIHSRREQSAKPLQFKTCLKYMGNWVKAISEHRVGIELCVPKVKLYSALLFLTVLV